MARLELSPEQFRKLCDEVADIAADFLSRLDNREIQPRAGAADMVRAFDEPWPADGLGAAAAAQLRNVVELSRWQNGRFFGYVMGSGEPAGAAADLLASVVNQNVTSWRSAPAATVIERTVVKWLAEAIGCSAFSGSLTGGGSSANLMALAMAREAKVPANANGARPGAVYCSAEAHMSIGKSVGLLGIGRNNLRQIPVDHEFRMKLDDLVRAIESDERKGIPPIAIVGTAGTVNTGAIDDLAGIADIAKRHRMWFHVDGAYGALAAIAAPEKFRGLAAADSLSLDPHKWLYQSVDCGCLLFRDAGAARAAFSHSGDYAKSLLQGEIESFMFFDESLELSRRFRALRLWLSMRYHGHEAFRAAIAEDLALALRLAQKITAEPSLELLAPVSLSAVCFRLAQAPNGGDLNAWNEKVMKRVVERGRVYLSNATLNGKFALRACITNHRTTAADVDAVVEEVLSVAKQP
jgi:aromatic-L-amino-acid/L-tryptophan decarboxylase